MSRAAMKKTAPSFTWNSKERMVKPLGVITCQVTGQWSHRVMCWTKIGEPNGNQYSLHRRHDGTFYFFQEATA